MGYAAAFWTLATVAVIGLSIFLFAMPETATVGTRKPAGVLEAS
jgi:hypothetical protein